MSKRDFLIELEKKAQDRWAKEKAFETDAPENGKDHAEETYFVTFPYPYMNGKLHLGHMFTMSKAEFAVGYQQLKGKKILFPFGFHCTGMPIKASADALKEEMETYGCPPQFPKEEEEEDKGNGKDAKAKKSKIAAKEGRAKYKWEILQDMGIPDEEIPKFADPHYWIEYFPPLAKEHLTRFGLKADWRRSFVTTDYNPYYDAFARWHALKLKEKHKIEFHKRHAVYSPKDKQPCMDHDRSKGEGIGPQEYTGIKMRMLELPECLKELGDKKVYLVAATLRPETMYGQTNCWISPTITYVAWKWYSKKSETSAPEATDEIFITTRRAARNMAYQDMTRAEGDLEIVAEVPGKDLMGLKIKAPMATYDHVYTLPMKTIAESKGTGVVTSVPSDAPDDYAALTDLKKDEKLRAKFGITAEMVEPYEPVAIITTPELGDMAAVKACTDAKVKSQNDRAKLAELKEVVYKQGFYSGTLLCGKYKGQAVQDAKPQVKEDMIASGEAITYFEPEGLVISRSGDECVVALTDQWYLMYGEPKWRAQAEEALAQLECYHDSSRHAFAHTLDWLKEHACSRLYGLGSRLPWDENWLIESLSDSTIYMAYYTIAHLLQDGDFRGAHGNPHGITPEQCDEKFFDYVFLSEKEQPAAEECKVSKDVLDKLRNEFQYFYPLDMRVSGKDLIPNHLTYCLYNHVAIWEDNKAMWPRSFRANGHLMLNGAKMSKSTGNFMTLEQCIEKYGTDATRMTLADGSDGVDDANFEEKTANANVLRLYKELEWIKAVVDSIALLKDGKADDAAAQDPSVAVRSGEMGVNDKAFENEINLAIRDADAAYKRMHFREALMAGFFTLQAARDRYRKVCVGLGEPLHAGVVERFVTVQALLLSPICPHVCEHIWALLGHEESITTARWPEAGPVDEVMLSSGRYLDDVETDLRQRINKAKARKKGPVQEITSVVLYVASTYPDWQAKILTYLKDNYNPDGATPAERFPDMKAVSQQFKNDPDMAKHKKLLMPFVAMKRDEAATKGSAAFDLTVTFNETQVLKENLPYLRKIFDLPIEVQPVEEADEKTKGSCRPGAPAIFFPPSE